MELLSDAQRQELRSILLLGCDRTTARNFLGLAPAQLREALAGDDGLAVLVARAEAAAELHHMRNVHGAAKDEKNWRASVWWLERRSPERFARRDAASWSPSELAEVLEELAAEIVAEIDDPDVRRRMVDRLLAVTSKQRPPGGGREKAGGEPAKPPHRNEADDAAAPGEFE